MKKLITTTSFLFSVFFCFSQMNYGYDAAGNRVSRIEVKAHTPGDKIDDAEEETVDNRTPDEIALETGIKVYPNPTAGIVNVEITPGQFSRALENGEDIIVMLMDHAGRQVLKKTIQDSRDQLDLKDVAVGKYLLTMQSSSIEQSWQIIKH